MTDKNPANHKANQRAHFDCVRESLYFIIGSRSSVLCCILNRAAGIFIL